MSGRRSGSSDHAEEEKFPRKVSPKPGILAPGWSNRLSKGILLRLAGFQGAQPHSKRLFLSHLPLHQTLEYTCRCITGCRKGHEVVKFILGSRFFQGPHQAIEFTGFVGSVYHCSPPF